MMFRVPPLPSSVFCAAAFNAAAPSRAFSAASSSARPQRFRPRAAPPPHVPAPSDAPLGPNDEISTHVRNRHDCIQYYRAKIIHALLFITATLE